MDPSRFTNWPAIRDFVPTARKDTYSYISPALADLRGNLSGLKREILAAAAATGRQDPLVLTFSTDVSSEAAVDAAAAEILKSFGSALGVLEINVKGAYLCAGALPPLLRRSCTRTVINTSSAGAHMLFEGLLGYQTSKFALCRLTELLAKEHEADRLVVIATHPGDVLTDMTSGTPDEWKGFFGQTPEMAGDTYAWIARERRDWLSGRFINTAWDMEELVARKDDILKGDLLKFRLAA